MVGDYLGWNVVGPKAILDDVRLDVVRLQTIGYDVSVDVIGLEVV